MEITKVSSKGQVVIPSRIREKLGIIEGSTIAIDIVDNMAVIKRIDIDLVNQFKKSLEDIKSGKIKKIA